MKGLNILSLVIVALTAMILIMPVITAQENESAIDLTNNTEEVEVDELEGNPGITPDNPFYGLDIALKRIRYAMTIGSEKKAAYGLKIAEERLLEAKKMAEKGDFKAMENAQSEHDKEIERVKVKVKELGDDGTEAKVKVSIKGILVLKNKIELHEHKIEILKKITSQENLTDEQRKVIEEIISRMENRTEFLKQNAEERKDRMKLRYKAITEKNETEIEDEIEDIEDDEGITDERKARAERDISRTKAALEKLKHLLEKEKTEGTNVSVIEEQVASVEKLIDEAEAKMKEGDYEGAIEILKEVNNYGRNVREIVRKIREAREEKRTEKVRELVKDAREEHIETLEEVEDKVKESGKEKIRENIRKEKLKIEKED